MTSQDRTVVPGVGTVVLRGVAVSPTSDEYAEFAGDCARNVEGLLPESELRAKYRLSDDDWARLENNEQLLRAVRTELDRRIMSGEAAREAAQRHFAQTPSILNDILRNEAIAPRARIEAAKELRQVAAGAREHMATGEKFSIVIDLGGDCRLVREFEQPARLRGDDGDEQ